MGVQGGAAVSVGDGAVFSVAAALPYCRDGAIGKAGDGRTGIRRQIHAVVKPFRPLQGVIPVAEIGGQHTLHRRLVIEAQNCLPHTDVFRQILVGIEHKVHRLQLLRSRVLSRRRDRVQRLCVPPVPQLRQCRAVRCPGGGLPGLRALRTEHGPVHLVRRLRRGAVLGKQAAHSGKYRLHIDAPGHGFRQLLADARHPSRQQQLRRHQQHENAAAGHQTDEPQTLRRRQGIRFSGLTASHLTRHRSFSANRCGCPPP